MWVNRLTFHFTVHHVYSLLLAGNASPPVTSMQELLLISQEEAALGPRSTSPSKSSNF